MTDKEVFSSGPSYTSPYTPDDYDADGRLIRLKEIPLLDRPLGISAQLDAHTDAQVGPDKPVRRIEVSKPPVQNAKTALKAPEEFLSADHYIAIVAYLDARHPDEEVILEHWARQQAAKKAGTYNPIEDPPVDLRQLRPQLAVQVLRTFSVADAMLDDGKMIRDYVSNYSKRTDYNVLSLQCGYAQPLPIPDTVRGQYKEEMMNQFMKGFYDGQEAARKNIIQRATTAPAQAAK
jgi:hypothetical protein